MKKLILLILLIVVYTIAYTQNVVKIIRLNPDSTLKDLRFSCLEVLDARTNKENIGSVQVGIGNTKALARFEEEFTAYLKGTLTKMLPKEKDKLGLVFIIRDLTISEKTESMSELGFCRIEIEFAKKVDTLLYSLGIFDAHIVGGGMDVTSSHGKRILLGLEECIRKLDETNWENAKEFIIEDINHQLVYDYKNIPPKGVYLSFQQMLRGTPTDSVDLKIKQVNESKKNLAYNVKINKKDNPKDVLFVSDGEDIYLRINKYQFVKSRFHGKYIYFEGRFSTPSNPEIGLYFGLVGAIIVDVANNSLKGVILETETGQLKAVTDFNIVNITKPFPEILKEYRTSKRDLEAKENVIKKLNAKFN